jgi:CHASE3 domain sensor protein
MIQVLSIRMRLVCMFAFSLIALATVGWYGLAGMQEMKSELTRTYNTDFVPMRIVAEANHALVVLHREMLGYLLEEDTSQMAAYRQTIFLQKNVLQDRLLKLSEIEGLTEKEVDLVRSLEQNLQKILPLSEEVIDLLRAGQRQATVRAISSQVRPLLDEMDANMNEFLEIQKLESFATVQAANDLYKHTLIVELVCLGSFFVISFLLYFLVAIKMFRQPLPKNTP